MITINGKDYGLHYPLSALRKFEKRTRLNVFGLSDPSKLSSEACAYLVWYGVKAWADMEGEELEVDWESFCDQIGLKDVQTAFKELLGDEPEEEKKI